MTKIRIVSIRRSRPWSAYPRYGPCVGCAAMWVPLRKQLPACIVVLDSRVLDCIPWLLRMTENRELLQARLANSFVPRSKPTGWKACIGIGYYILGGPENKNSGRHKKPDALSHRVCADWLRRFERVNRGGVGTFHTWYARVVEASLEAKDVFGKALELYITSKSIYINLDI